MHCAAGVHRTGTLGYTFLRLGGMEANEAFEALKVMREETYKGVGDWRIKLAEDELVPYIKEQLAKESKGISANIEEEKKEDEKEDK